MRIVKHIKKKNENRSSKDLFEPLFGFREFDPLIYFTRDAGGKTDAHTQFAVIFKSASNENLEMRK